MDFQAKFFILIEIRKKKINFFKKHYLDNRATWLG